MWDLFRHYHYLNTDKLITSNKNYVAFYNNQPVAFISVGRSQYKYKYWLISRLVVLPDYQGIGIGLKLLTFIAKTLYDETRQNVFIISSNPQLIHLRNNPRWILKRLGHAQGANNRYRREKGLINSSSKNRLTFSFKYKPETHKP
jgi:GNAT superfamily N-acetyltransferase